MTVSFGQVLLQTVLYIFERKVTVEDMTRMNESTTWSTQLRDIAVVFSSSIREDQKWTKAPVASKRNEEVNSAN